MRQHAYKNKMDEQLKKVGEKTKFKKGETIIYERSDQTKKRLKEHGKNYRIKEE